MNCRQRCLSIAEVESVLAASRCHWSRLLVLVLIMTDARIGDVLGLRLEDLHLLPDPTALGYFATLLAIRSDADAVGGQCMRWLSLAARTFVVTGLAFGVVMAVIRHSIIGGVTASIGFGIAMSGFATAATAWSTRGRPGSLSTKQHVTFTSTLMPDQVHDAVVRALTAMSAKITADSVSHVSARTKTSWRSWGEVLTVDVTPSVAGVQIAILSRPRLRTTVADYGRNQENVARIESMLREAPTQNSPRGRSERTQRIIALTNS